MDTTLLPNPVITAWAKERDELNASSPKGSHWDDFTPDIQNSVLTQFAQKWRDSNPKNQQVAGWAADFFNRAQRRATEATPVEAAPEPQPSNATFAGAFPPNQFGLVPRRVGSTFGPRNYVPPNYVPPDPDMPTQFGTHMGGQYLQSIAEKNDRIAMSAGLLTGQLTGESLQRALNEEFENRKLHPERFQKQPGILPRIAGELSYTLPFMAGMTVAGGGPAGLLTAGALESMSGKMASLKDNYYTLLDKGLDPAEAWQKAGTISNISAAIMGVASAVPIGQTVMAVGGGQATKETLKIALGERLGAKAAEKVAGLAVAKGFDNAGATVLGGAANALGGLSVTGVAKVGILASIQGAENLVAEGADIAQERIQGSDTSAYRGTAGERLVLAGATGVGVGATFAGGAHIRDLRSGKVAGEETAARINGVFQMLDANLRGGSAAVEQLAKINYGDGPGGSAAKLTTQAVWDAATLGQSGLKMTAEPGPHPAQPGALAQATRDTVTFYGRLVQADDTAKVATVTHEAAHPYFNQLHPDVQRAAFARFQREMGSGQSALLTRVEEGGEVRLTTREGVDPQILESWQKALRATDPEEKAKHTDTSFREWFAEHLTVSQLDFVSGRVMAAQDTSFFGSLTRDIRTRTELVGRALGVQNALLAGYRNVLDAPLRTDYNPSLVIVREAMGLKAAPVPKDAAAAPAPTPKVADPAPESIVGTAPKDATPAEQAIFLSPEALVERAKGMSVFFKPPESAVVAPELKPVVKPEPVSVTELKPVVKPEPVSVTEPPAAKPTAAPEPKLEPTLEATVAKKVLKAKLKALAPELPPVEIKPEIKQVEAEPSIATKEPVAQDDIASPMPDAKFAPKPAPMSGEKFKSSPEDLGYNYGAKADAPITRVGDRVSFIQTETVLKDGKTIQSPRGRVGGEVVGFSRNGRVIVQMRQAGTATTTQQHFSGASKLRLEAALPTAVPTAAPKSKATRVAETLLERGEAITNTELWRLRDAIDAEIAPQRDAKRKLLDFEEGDLSKRGDDPLAPNRSLWLAPDGGTYDVEFHGATPDGSGYSHGLYIKQWVRDRLSPRRAGKFPEAEVDNARRMKARVDEMLAADPALRGDVDEDGQYSIFSADQTWNQAAQERGWVRIKPMPHPTNRATIFAESAGDMSAAQRAALQLATDKGMEVRYIRGGALANRAAFSEYRAFVDRVGQEEGYLTRRGDLVDETTVGPRGALFVSPNIREGLNFNDAVTALRGERHAQVRAFAEKVDKWLPPSERHDAIGDWKDGAENSTVTMYGPDVPYKDVRVAGALLGDHARQKSVLTFRSDPFRANSVLYDFILPGTFEDARVILTRHGFEHRTLVDHKDGVRVMLFDNEASLVDNVRNLSYENDTKITRVRGYGEFLGSWNSREDGAKVFRDVTGRAGSAFQRPLLRGRDGQGDAVYFAQLRAEAERGAVADLSTRGSRQFPERAAEGDPVLKDIRDNRPDIAGYDTQVIATGKAEANMKTDAELVTSADRLTDMVQTDTAKNFLVLDGLELMQRALAKGDRITAEGAFDTISKAGTTFGQLLRQFAELKATPAHVAAVVEIGLGKKGLMLQPHQKADLKAKLAAADTATAAHSAAVDAALLNPSDATYKVAEAAESVARRAKLNWVRDLEVLLPRESLSQDMLTVIQGNLLTPKSELRNFLSNYSRGVIDLPARTVGAMGDAVWSAITGTPRTVKMPTLTEGQWFATASMRAVPDAVDTLLRGPGGSDILGERIRGFHPVDALIKAFNGDLPVDMGTGRVPLKLRTAKLAEAFFGATPEPMLRGLAAFDNIAKAGLRASRMAQEVDLRSAAEGTREYAEAKLMATRQLKATADEAALEGTFQNASAPAMAASAVEGIIRRTAGEPGVTAFRLMTSVYQRTPLNVLATTLPYLVPPLAAVQMVYHARTGNRREAGIDFGKFWVGSTIAAIADLLLRDNLISGGPESEENLRRLQGSEDMGYYRVNLTGLQRKLDGGDGKYQTGDTSVRLDLLGVPGVLLGVRADMARIDGKSSKNRVEGEPTFNLDVFGEVLGMSRFMVETTMFQNVGKGLRAVANGEFAPYLQNLFQQVSVIRPDFANTVTALRHADQPYRADLTDRGNGKNTVEQVWENVIKHKKGEWDDLPRKLNLWGQPIPNVPAGRNPYVYNLVDVLMPMNRQDAAVTVIRDAFTATGDKGVIPGWPNRVLSYKDLPQGMYLPGKMYESYVTAVQGAKLDGLKMLMADKDFQKADGAVQAKAMHRIYDRVGGKAELRWRYEHRDELEVERTKLKAFLNR